jgi:RecB family exonuclease
MASVAEALTELGIKEWVLRGEPTNEAEFNSMFRKVTGADANGTAVESSNPADFGTDWATVSAKQAELTAAEPLKALRVERNRRLAATDWNALSDVTMSAEMTAYRQALRDITQTYSSLADVVWPTQP